MPVDSVGDDNEVDGYDEAILLDAEDLEDSSVEVKNR